jgi:hypothetical protein
MKGGWWGGVIGACLVAVASVASGGQVSLFVDGEAVLLAHPTLWKDGQLLVPLCEFGLWLGAEIATVPEEGSIGVRWATGRESFSLDHFPVYGGLTYARLDELVKLVGAEIHTLGDAIYVEARPVLLTSFEASADRVSVRFDAFVPYEAIETGPGVIRLRFYRSSLTTPGGKRDFSGGPIASAELSAPTRRTVDLSVSFTPESLPETKRFEVPGFYSVSLSFDQRPLTEREEEILPGVTYHEIKTDLGKGSVRVKYLYIEDWRARYRLTPAIPADGIGRLASLKTMAQEHGAVAGINANFFDPTTNKPIGLLILDGEVLSSNYERRAALGIDLFGRLDFFRPTVSLYLRTDEEKVSIDDVNRPIKANELVAYSAGYAGAIAKSSAAPFRVIKVRSNRVTAVLDGLYVAEDRSATLLVASGAARSRLSGLRVGDAVNLEYTLDEGDLLITDVTSAGPLLIRGGEDVLDPAGEGFRVDSYLVQGLAARSVLATDWYGGLILLAVVDSQGSVGADFADLVTLLHGLPTKVRDAIAFDGGHSSSLVFKDGTTYRQVSSGGDVAVGLLLVPAGR